jgi:hypothetical protein
MSAGEITSYRTWNAKHELIGIWNWETKKGEIFDVPRNDRS